MRDVDLAGRWDALRTGRGAERSIRSRATAEARRLRELLGIRDSPGKPDRIGLLVALAYPERIARRRNAKEAKYQMAGGVGAIMPAWSPLTRAEWLAVAEVDGIGTEVRIFLASRVEKSELLELFADDVAIAEEVSWDPQEETVVARRVQKLGALIVGEQSLELHGPRGTGAMLEGVRQMGLGCLPWDKESSALRDRSEWLRIQRLVTDGWPDLGDEHLLSSLSGWLGPVLGGVSRKTHLARLDLASALRALFTRTQLRELDRLAPKTLKAPTGSMITLQYSPASPPVLAARNFAL